jgi:adenylate cyclase
MGTDAGPAWPVSGDAGLIPGLLVIAPDQADERSTPVYDWLVVGRECAGVDDRRRVVIDDPAISRTHLELWLDHERDQAWLTDRSTNGTRINGQRMERSMPVQIKPGDRVRLGGIELQFRSRRFTTVTTERRSETVREIAVADMVMVVGDILSFSTIAEYTDDRVLLHNIDRLYAELRQGLFRHHGTLSNYVGDAFFATWEIAAVPDAVTAAVDFAVEAVDVVTRVAPGLELRDPAGQPVRMGWGVACGQAAMSLLTGMLVSVLGDTTNVAFRLSGIAGRDGRPDVLVTDAVHRAAATGFTFTPPQAVQLKGRSQAVQALGASRR